MSPVDNRYGCTILRFHIIRMAPPRPFHDTGNQCVRCPLGVLSRDVCAVPEFSGILRAREHAEVRRRAIRTNRAVRQPSPQTGAMAEKNFISCLVSLRSRVVHSSASRSRRHHRARTRKFSA